ncbi:MAG: hypothetical protein J6B16_05140 [Clostridia bacterium]|nr:hypothetical protein [Clostridia bacterium]
MLNCIKEKTSYKKPILCLKDVVKVECKTDAPAMGNEILTVSPFVTPCEVDLFSGGLTYKSKIILTVCYIGANGVDSVECATEFTSSINNEKIAPSMRVLPKITVLKTDLPDFTGDTSASVTVNCEFIFYADEEINYIKSGDDLILQKDLISTTRLTDLQTSEVIVDEDFTLNYPVSKVVLHKEKIYPVKVSSGIDCIIIEGEAVIFTYLLQNGENSDIIKEMRVLPFKVEVGIEGVMPKTITTANLELKSAKYDVVVDEETSKTSINVTLNLRVLGYIFTDELTELPLDAFCLKKEIALTKTDAVFTRLASDKTYTLKFNERVNLSPEPEPGARILFTLAEDFTVTDYAFNDGVLSVDGAITAKTVIKDADGIIKTVNYKFLIELSQKIDDVVDNFEIFDYTSLLTDINARFITLSEAECYGTVKLVVRFKTDTTVKYLSDVATVSDKKINDSAISVYIALNNESLWGLAKRLNIAPSAVVELNPELEFPLTGDERIIIFRQMNKEY